MRRFVFADDGAVGTVPFFSGFSAEESPASSDLFDFESMLFCQRPYGLSPPPEPRPAVQIT